MTALVFRELTSSSDIAGHLRLRREVYAASPDLAFIVARSDRELAADEFDVRSRLYGLFVDTVLAGAIRTTRVPWQMGGHELVAVVADRHELEAIVLATPSVVLPMMVDSPDVEALGAFVERHRRAGTVVTEASRFVIGPAARNHGLGLLAAPTFVIECAMAAMLVVDGADVAITGIRASQLRMYRRFGVSIIDGVSERAGGPFAAPVTSVEVTLASIPTEVRRRVDRHADQLVTGGFAVR